MCTILTIFFLFPLSPFFEVFLPYGLFFWCVFSYQYHLSFGPAKTINTQGSPSIPAPLFTLRTLFISFIAKLWVSGRLVLTVHSSYFPSSFLEHVIWRKRELKTDGMIWCITSVFSYPSVIHIDYFQRFKRRLIGFSWEFFHDHGTEGRLDYHQSL